MSNIKMKIVPKPDDKKYAVFVTDDKECEFVLSHNGFGNFVCGNCKRLLVKNVNLGDLVGVYVKCPQCDEYNQC